MMLVPTGVGLETKRLRGIVRLILVARRMEREDWSRLGRCGERVRLRARGERGREGRY